MSLFDMLGIDDTTGIDPQEIEAIKNALERLKVEAAQWAKTHASDETLAFTTALVLYARDLVRKGEMPGATPNNAGQPALALGAGGGTTPPLDENAALDTFMHSPLIDPGVKAALRRLLNPKDPDPIIVESDGTPKDLKAAQSQLAATQKQLDDVTKAKDKAEKDLDDATKAKDKAEAQLKDEQNEGKLDSLAAKLKAAEAKAASGAPDKTKLETAFNAVLDAADNLSARPTMSGPKVTGVDELKTKVGKLKTVVGL